MGLGSLLNPNRLITLGILFFTSIPIHEWAHAWAAYQLGDDTAARRGRLTINPLAHLDPLGTLSIVLVGYGWGKPVPVNHYRLRGDRRASRALVSFAGPFSNLVLAILAAIPFRMGWVNVFNLSGSAISLQTILLEFIFINLGLMIFNLIPIPPLDGSRVLAWLLPARWASALDRLEQIGGAGLMMVVFLLSRLGVLSALISPLYRFMIGALLPY